MKRRLTSCSSGERRRLFSGLIEGVKQGWFRVVKMVTRRPAAAPRQERKLEMLSFPKSKHATLTEFRGEFPGLELEAGTSKSPPIR
jgi:hypothetical protein